MGPLLWARLGTSKPVQQTPHDHAGLDSRFGYESDEQSVVVREPTPAPSPKHVDYAARKQHRYVSDAKFCDIYDWISAAEPPQCPRKAFVDQEMSLKRRINGPREDKDGFPAGAEAHSFNWAQRASTYRDNIGISSEAAFVRNQTCGIQFIADFEELGCKRKLAISLEDPYASGGDMIRVAAWQRVEGMEEETRERESSYRAAAFQCAAQLESSGLMEYEYEECESEASSY